MSGAMTDRRSRPLGLVLAILALLAHMVPQSGGMGSARDDVWFGAICHSGSTPDERAPAADCSFCPLCPAPPAPLLVAATIMTPRIIGAPGVRRTWIPQPRTERIVQGAAQPRGPPRAT